MINRRRLFSNNEDTLTYTLNFQYTGDAQDVILTKGTYKLECWGAQGGANSAYSSYNITSQAGGKGGYSVGQLTVSNNTAIKVYVGGQGTSSSGGFNGGGSTTGTSQYSSGTSGQAGYTFGYSKMGGGGGATDIRLSDGSLYSRMIVAGGGSGGAMTYRKEIISTTTTTTSYSQVTSANSSGPNIYTDAVFNACDFALTSLGLSAGDKIRFKVTKTASGSGSTDYRMYWVYNSSGTKLKSGNYSFDSYVSFTLPSNSYSLSIHTGHRDKNASSSTPTPDSFSVVLEKGTDTVTGTDQTSTSNDSQVGYVGGGTNGGGYSSTYYGKQNGAGSGGSFGQGANQTTTNYRHCSGAGGGGWYGGGSAYSDSTMSYVKYMGGGSGWVNTAASSGNRPSGYTGLELDSGTTYAGNTSFIAPGGGNETGHSGNGYARITKLIICSVKLHFRTINNEPVEGLPVTVTGISETYSLTTNSEGKISFNTSLEGSAKTYNISCFGYTTSIQQFTVSKNVVLNIQIEESSTLEYEYTGTMQSITLKAGTYKIECWGAQGGNAKYSSYTGTGGKGGYSVGELTISENTTLKIYVGGQGTFNSGSSAATPGGFNGGGTGYNYSTNYLAAGGGGASDVRIETDSLYARIIVAGGGGGSGVYSSTAGTGGYGGGTSGGTGSVVYSSYGVGTGGTQTAAGTCNGSGNYIGTASFGIGASKTAGTSGYNGAGGGGGWYGGGCGGAVSNCGGGGSGYVYTASTASNYPSGCLLNSVYYLTNAETIAGNQSFPSPSGVTEVGHEGDGYIRITKI